MPMPIVCALVPSYKVEVARLARPALREEAILVVDKLERGRVLDLDARAYALGARTGMTLLQAGSCAREALTVVDDPARDRAVWECVLDALDAASPLVEDAGEGVAFLEMRGIANPERWLESVRDALAATTSDAREALPFSLALAANKFTARAAATVARNPTVVRPGEERAFLASLRLRILPIDEATIERLRLLGVRTLGELAALPHGPFVRRFGPEAARWHACAHGIDRRPLVPRPRALRIDRSLYGEGTAEREDQLLFALRTLVARVADDVALVGKRCGFLRLGLECEDGEMRELATTLAQPTSQPATMFDLLRARLEGVVLRAPVVGLRLGAERLEEGGAELSLFAGGDPDPEIVGIALARLEAALGPNSALRARVVDGNRFESRFCYEPFSASAVAPDPARRRAMQPAQPRPEQATLALRLVTPRAIDVVLREGMPAFVGTPPQAVLDVAGPWRADEAWWDDALGSGASATLRRDEYDVLLEDGALYRIACDSERWTIRGTYD
jgi:protein ImuB